MTADKLHEMIDDELRALTVHDVGARRAARTRERCVAALAEQAARRRPTAPPLPAVGGGGTWGVIEPLGAVAISVLYLAFAVRASLVLLAVARW